MSILITRCALLVAAAAALSTGSTANGQYKLTTVTTFNNAGGYEPYASLLADASGNLYGTAVSGGTNNGTVFEVAAGTHALTTLAAFNGTNGSLPEFGLIADSSGNLYGTTTQGGDRTLNGGYGYGTVFEVAAGTHELTALGTFNGTNGANPSGGLLADASGNLYGTTYNGGAKSGGTVFEVAAGTHALSTLVTFNGSPISTDGADPQCNLIVDASGNLYGTTNFGGANHDGTVFEVAVGTHALSTLVSFNGSNGAHPLAGLIADASGNLYGTTTQGSGPNGKGTVFEVAAGTHVLSTLATFNGSNGATPYANLLADASGNLYGTTNLGGPNNDGTVFEAAAGTHIMSTLVIFNGANGANPFGGLVADASGNFYGTTAIGGANNDGIVFELSPVPEPCTLALGISALVAGALMLWRRTRSR